MNDKELKQLAKEAFLEYKENGNVPEEIANFGYMSDDEIEMYANENGLTVEEYSKYLEYLMEYYQ